MEFLPAEGMRAELHTLENLVTQRSENLSCHVTVFTYLRPSLARSYIRPYINTLKTKRVALLPSYIFDFGPPRYL